VLTPTIGIPESLTYEIDLRMVPSPPILIKKANESSKSLKD
jgi:hypothetical protein